MRKNGKDREKQLKELEILIEIDKICRDYNIEYYLAYGSVLGAVRHSGFIPWDIDVDIMVEVDQMDKLIEVLELNLPSKYNVFSGHNDSNYDSLKPRIGFKNIPHHELHVDIFPMVGISESKIVQKIKPKIASLLYLVFFLKKFDSEEYHKDNKSKRIKHRIVKIFLYILPIKLLKIIVKKLWFEYPIKDSIYIYNPCSTAGTKEIIPRKYLNDPVFQKFEGHQLPIPREWDKYLTHMYGNYMKPVKY